jgi:hypothetical protein
MSIFVRGLGAVLKITIDEARRDRQLSAGALTTSHLEPPISTTSSARGSTTTSSTATSVSLPTTSETVAELRKRLGKELYRMELDLMSGGRIAGRPCDCVSQKHNLGIEATAEELIPMDNRPVYSKIISWLNAHSKEFEPEEIAKREPDYYRSLSREVRNFRKEVMGTEKVESLLRGSK